MMEKGIRFLWIVAIGLAGLFLITLTYRPYPLAYLVKSIPIFCLAFIVLIKVPGGKGKLLSIGFLFAGIGDILLELPSKNLFVYGLGFFLTAHLFYISVFLRSLTFTKPRLISILLILIYGGGIGAYLFPNLGSMLVPIVIYLGVILVMGISASLGGDNHPLIILGACLFIISDSIIAISRFLTPVACASLWIMISYYPAQMLIALGAVRGQSRNH